MLKLKDHRLSGAGVSQQPTPNTGGALRPRFLILHYTAGRDLESSVRSLNTRKPQGNASAHVVIGRDGRIVQLAPFSVQTWHAGVSQWNGINGLNAHAIGIELDNAGRLHQEGDRFVAWFGKAYPPREVVQAAHRHGGGPQPWHAYSEVQIARTLELCELLVAQYGLQDVLGHEDVARGRKTDPGPAFPLTAVRARALGRGMDADPRWVVTASRLNIRSGPAASFDMLGPALPKGTELIRREAQDRWSQVEVVGGTDREGWVSNDFISPAPRPRSAGETVLPRSQRSTSAAMARSRAAPAQPAKRPVSRRKATTTQSPPKSPTRRTVHKSAAG